MSTRAQTVIAIAVVSFAVLTFARTVQADPPGLPTSCSSGELVVSRGGSSFECMSVREALHVDNCSSNDFVIVDSGGRLGCLRPSNTPWGIKGLLPDCSGGSTLVSEGFGSWKCVAGSK